MQSLNDILHVARENNYSDVHLGGQNNIMIRNNGILYPYEHSYSVDDVVAMILSMLSISQKEKLEQGKDIDLVYVENMNRYRVNVYKERGQLCAALRIIYERIRSLDELHLPPVLRQLTQENRGLVLLTGPTGSGKSTTLYTVLKEIIRLHNKNIITIEDPIEMHLQDCLQIELNETLGITYHNTLKQILRHDPDVIMIGEIRDEQTAKIAITCALTGHLVLTTIHASNAPLGISQVDIIDVVIGAISQKMIYDKENERVIVLSELMNQLEIKNYLEKDCLNYINFSDQAEQLISQGFSSDLFIEEAYE